MRILLPFVLASTLVFAQGAKNAEDVYKNITHLKGTPADQLLPSMQFMAASLGVECSFCHVQGKNDADDINHKKIARSMITMMANLNKETFGGKPTVTCFTCHQGADHPIAVPPVEQPFAVRKAPAPAAAQAKTADDLINRYISAMGGEAAIRNITSRVQKGDMEVGNSATPIEVITKAPNQRISISKSPNGAASLTGFDGKTGWMGAAGRPTREMSAPESWAAGMDAEFYFGLRIKELFTSAPMRVGRAPAKVNGFDCDVLNATGANGLPVRMYFDRDTGLLARIIRFTQTPVGPNPTQIDYADYRESGGVKIPFRWTLARPNGRFAIQVASVENNATIDPARFNKP
jgi:photosynthetic reaction center cytochrome c subunit